jgi:hypothetical protein
MDIKASQKEEKKGDEALKTSMFKWSKDHASAAIHYDEAHKGWEANHRWADTLRV